MSNPVRCFLTGLELPIERAYVLNRRDARDLLAALKDRTAILQRLIDQFSPLDVKASPPYGPQPCRSFTNKRHRLISKTAADALCLGFAEIKLFIPWPEYRTSARLVALRGLRDDPARGEAISALDHAALRGAAKLGRNVLRLLDPQHRLPADVRTAIAGGACVRLRALAADAVATQIRRAAAGERAAAELGLGEMELAAVRQHLGMAGVAVDGQPAGDDAEQHEAQ